MEQVRTLNINGTRETFQEILVGGTGVPELTGPLQSIAGDLVVRAEKTPCAVCVCSSDADSDLRNFFAFVIARAMRARVPDVIVVDCDFLSVGLSSVVPERDALGFLDLLLYGSSLDVITQKTSDGIHVIGAGSFPVSRKSPFVMDAFEETVRYLRAHSRCVIFCGPALDDDNNAHPILGGVDLRLLVRSGKPKRPNTLDAVEEKIAAEGGETWMIRVSEPSAQAQWRRAGDRESDEVPAAASALQPAPQDELPAPDEDEGIMVGEAAEAPAPEPAAPPLKEPPVAPRPAAKAPRKEPPPAARKKTAPTARKEPEVSGEQPPEWDEVKEVAIDRRSGNSIFPRLIIGTISVLLIGFVAWWLYLTRSIRDQVDEPFDMTQVEMPADETDAPASEQSGGAGDAAPAGGDAAQTTTGEGQEAPADDTTSEVQPPPADAVAADQTTTPAEPEPQATPTETTTPAPRPAASDSPSGELDAYAGQYLIHVSSFRRRDLAETEAAYFKGRGYPTIVAEVDLGEKGRWNRVYVGPFATRDDAMRLKIRLDENPRVRSTRITKVPG